MSRDATAPPGRSESPRGAWGARSGPPMSARLSTATIALRTRPRPLLGPALGRSRLPLGTILVSAVFHLLAIGALGFSAVLWQDPPQKTYIVNLVPADAAIGRPQGQSSPPVLPPRSI